MAQHFITITENSYKIETEKSLTTRTSNKEVSFTGAFNQNSRDMVLTQQGSNNEARFTSYDPYHLDNLIVNDINRLYLERSGGSVDKMHLHQVKNLTINNYNNHNTLEVGSVFSNTLVSIKINKESGLIGALQTPLLRSLQLDMNENDQLPIMPGETNLFVMDKIIGPNYRYPSQPECDYIFAIFKTNMSETKLLSYWKENGQDKFQQTHNGNLMNWKTFREPFNPVLYAQDNETKIKSFLHKIESLEL